MLKGAFEIGLGEIAADIKQGAGTLLGDFIGKAVAEIQPRRMCSSAPACIGCGGPRPALQISKPSPSILRVISSPTLRRAATIRASVMVPAEMTSSVSVS